MANTYKTNVSTGWSDMGDVFRMAGKDGIIRCPQEAPYQCGYAEGNPVCVSHPSLCTQKGDPSGAGNGFNFVPIAHPVPKPKSGTMGWCGGNCNKLMPATQTWTRECRSTMPDIHHIFDGVYGDGLPFLGHASPFPTVDACHSHYTAKVSAIPTNNPLYKAYNEKY